jgi:hypothetical protein
MELLLAVVGAGVLLMWLFWKPSRALQIEDSLQSIANGTEALKAGSSEWAQRALAVSRLERQDMKLRVKQNVARKRVERLEERDVWLAQNPEHREHYEKIRKQVENALASSPSVDIDNAHAAARSRESRFSESNTLALEHRIGEPTEEIEAWAREEYAHRKAVRDQDLEAWFAAKPDRRNQFAEAIDEMSRH